MAALATKLSGFHSKIVKMPKTERRGEREGGGGGVGGKFFAE